MINKILGTLFLLASGLIYTFERWVSQIVWLGEMGAFRSTPSASYPAQPELPGFFTNVFVLVFALLGIVMIAVGVLQSPDDKVKK